MLRNTLVVNIFKGKNQFLEKFTHKYNFLYCSYRLGAPTYLMFWKQRHRSINYL